MTARGNVEAIYPLTPVQDGILFHTLYAPETPLYIQQFVAELSGALDVAAFQEAWALVGRRHEALRSLLTWEDRSRPLQIVRNEAVADWVVEDWRHVDASELEHELAAWLDDDRGQGFDLERAPLMRLALLRTGDEHHRFVWTHHHVVIDGWSIGIVLQEVAAAYTALVAGVEPQLEPAPAYRSYVQWLQRRTFDDAEPFWRKELDGVDSTSRLPIESTTVTSPWAEHHAEHVFRLPAAETGSLLDAARRAGVTASTMLRAAWAIVLSRYSGNRDVTFGATVAGRPADVDGVLEMVGMFVNTLPVRARVDEAMPLRSWLTELQRQQLAMAHHESTPLVSVQGWSDVPPGEPLFSTVLVFENVPAATDFGGGLAISGIRYLQRSNYPLALLVMPGDALELIFLYDSDRYTDSAIARLADQLGVVLAALPSHLDRSVGDIPIVPETELHQVVVEWNETAVPIDDDVVIHDLIARAAEADPERAAVVGGDITLTYRQLADRADAIAGRLAGLGAGPGSTVAVAIERSPAFIAAMLGVLRSGAAYVPVDPTAPLERTRHIVDDVAAIALVAVSPAEAVAAVDIPVVRIGVGGELIGEGSGPAALRSATPDDVAYVLYTSGSTGTPKGVEVTHRNLAHSTLARSHAYSATVAAYLLLSPVIFDSSVAGIYWTLVQGGTLVMPEAGMEQDVNHLGTLIAEHGVTHTLALPSLYGLLLDHVAPPRLGTLGVVIVAGEACPPALISRHYRALPGAELYNEYGPTECTVWATVHRIEPDDDAAARTSIGRPIPNTQVFILDDELRPAPIGVPGELCIAGANVARGYLGRPELTAESFTTKELPIASAVRFYRTGDIARWNDDGTLDLLGRRDHQVKIRGQRIELGEIESTLTELDGVRDAAATVVAGDHGTVTLVAHAETEQPEEELIRHLRNRLPAAMVPGRIVTVPALPRGATGKIDRNALPDVAGTPESRAFVAPSGETEERLASIWSDVLGVDRVGATDNFFELGGDSILSIRIIARAHEAGLRITPRQFFETPTVGELAATALSEPG